MSTWGRNNGEQSPKKNWSLEEARGKLETYCSYQERCIWELRRKLFEKGIQGQAVDTILAELEASGFVDEERFARSYARGKFRIKKWGKGRITQELKGRQISSALIQLGLSEIDRSRKRYRADYKFAYAFFILILSPILVLRRFLKATFKMQHSSTQKDS